MAITEQEILNQIEAARAEQKEARGLVSFHKKAVDDAESRLITANLQVERLQEQLRILRVQNPIQEETANEKDIREFKGRLPEILQKI